MQVEISRYYMQRIEEFAEACLESNVSQYAKRKQLNKGKIYNDIVTGKMGEFGVYLYLKSLGLSKVTKPDLVVYGAKAHIIKEYIKDKKEGITLLDYMPREELKHLDINMVSLISEWIRQLRILPCKPSEENKTETVLTESVTEHHDITSTCDLINATLEPQKYTFVHEDQVSGKTSHRKEVFDSTV